MFSALEQGDIESYKLLRSELMNNMVIKDGEKINGKDIDSDLRSRYKKAIEDDATFTLKQEAMDIIGKIDEYTRPEEKEEKFTSENLDSKDYDKFADMRAEGYRDLANDVEDLPIFKGMTAEDKDKVLEAAYGYAETMNLLEVTGGTVSYEKDPVTDEEKAFITVDGVEYPFTMTKWMEKAADAEDLLGITTAEYIALGKEYSFNTMDSKGIYKAYEAEIDAETYLEFHEATKDFKADRDEDGKAISGSLKEKVMDYMDTMGLTDEEYAALLEAAGYKSDDEKSGFGSSSFGNSSFGKSSFGKSSFGKSTFGSK